MQRKGKQPGEGERGSAAVEFALVLPLVLTMALALVQVGLLGGARAHIDLARLLHRRLTITGSTLRARTVEEKGALARDVEANVWPLLTAGRVAPIIDRTFPLTAAADAHRRMESGEHIGKIVLTNS